MPIGIKFEPTIHAVAVDDTHAADLRARMAIKLAEHFGIVAGFPDGEDSAGRAKLGLLPPERVVERAVTIADLLVKRMESNGWLHEIPAKLPRPEKKPPTQGDLIE